MPKSCAIGAELVRIQYRQIRRATLSSLLVVGFVAFIATYFGADRWIFVWLSLYAAYVAAEHLQVTAFWRANPHNDAMTGWRWSASLLLAINGALWGFGLFAFIDPDQPLAIGLLVCAMAGLTAGSIGFRSTILAGFYVFNALIAIPFAARMFLEPGPVFAMLGGSSLAFALVIMGYGKAQHGLIRESLAIRFSNDALLAALADQKAAAEAALLRAEAANLAKSQFLAAASHDLRQPLYALGLFSSSLEELKLDSGGRDVVRRIQDSIGTMESSFEGLLDLSKLEAGVVTPRLEPVDVDALFDRINQIFGPLALERGLELRLRSDGERVTSDAVLLEQVIGNLVSNAIRATKAGGVLLAARRRGAKLDFEVWDTGSGIAASDVERIFGDYVQLDNPERDRRRGLGLGLAIAQRSVRLLDARIDVASRPGRGSRFRFSQTRCAGHDALLPTSSIAEQAVIRRGNDPVLLVEDNEDVRAALGNLLTRWGVIFEAEATAQAGLQRLTGGNRFGLLITDQRLVGGMTGLELIKAMRAQIADPPPAIIITGEMDSPLLNAAMEENVTVLHKPVRAEHLRRLVGDTTVRDSL